MPRRQKTDGLALKEEPINSGTEHKTRDQKTYKELYKKGMEYASTIMKNLNQHLEEFFPTYLLTSHSYHTKHIWIQIEGLETVAHTNTLKKLNQLDAYEDFLRNPHPHDPSHYPLFRINIYQPLMNTHLPLVPSSCTLPARRLPNRHTQPLRGKRFRPHHLDARLL